MSRRDSGIAGALGDDLRGVLGRVDVLAGCESHGDDEDPHPFPTTTIDTARGTPT